MITYWLWYGVQIVASVRLPGGASHDSVIAAALDWHRRVPLCNQFENPGDRANKIRMAEVKVYPPFFN